MKKVLTMAAVVLALFACKKEGSENPTPIESIEGVWELSNVATKVSVGDIQVSVFVEFASDNTFTLYQKIGEGRYSKFNGSYAMAADGKLSGSYSGGSSWGPYDAVVDDKALILTSAGGKEVDTYKRVDAVPTSVTNNLY